MTNWMRLALCALSLAAVAGFWMAGSLGTGAALALGAASLVLAVWPAGAHRRRDSALRYVEMIKAPVSLR